MEKYWKSIPAYQYACMAETTTEDPCEDIPVATKHDTVSHPSHYNHGRIEVIDFIEDQHLGFHLGNVVKYVCRAGFKDDKTEIEDLKKAAWYLNRHIEMREREMQ